MKRYPIIVIGAGAAGLVIAIGAARAGKKVLLIEKGPFGGDCTNYGCIPSKTLIAASKKGLEAYAALQHVRAIVDRVRASEEPEQLETIGVDTIRGEAFFHDRNTLSVHGELIQGDDIVIATGSRPFIPEIEGLKGTPFCTNETIFQLKKIPKSLIVLGGGPIGCELAQSFQRLRLNVSLVHSHEQLLQREEKNAQELLKEQFEEDGISLYLGKRPSKVTYSQNRFSLFFDDGRKVEGECLLVAVGRRVDIDALQLEKVGVGFEKSGITIDQYGRTSQKHIWAVGDVVGPPFFTHRAENQARAVLTSLLLPFFFKKKIKEGVLPRVTYTDPEIASVGISEKEVTQRKDLAIYTLPLEECDRAITASNTRGYVRVITKKYSSKILGATIVAERGGEMLSELLVAMHYKIPLRKLALVIHPYPTYSRAIRKVADKYLKETILPLLKRK